MITELTLLPIRNDLIISQIIIHLRESRKILVLSHRRNHCETLILLLKNNNINAGLYLGGMNTVSRSDSVIKDVILGTYQASGEGFDVPLLDTLILATPKRDVIQAVGRILRQKNKNSPLVVDIIDPFSIFKFQYYSRKKYYSTI
jgi:superfamily II DNA or RNA helicase